MKYTVIVEEGLTSYGAYVPDLPGCVAVADTQEEVSTLIQEAIVSHMELLAEHGQPIPEPRSSAQWADV